MSGKRDDSLIVAMKHMVGNINSLIVGVDDLAKEAVLGRLRTRADATNTR